MSLAGVTLRLVGRCTSGRDCAAPTDHSRVARWVVAYRTAVSGLERAFAEQRVGSPAWWASAARVNAAGRDLDTALAPQ